MKIKNIMNVITFYKSIIVSLVIFLPLFSCNDNINTDEESDSGNFSLMGETFHMNACKITSYGKENGLYVFTVELNGKDNKQIYLKLHSINDSFNDDFHRVYTYGEGPNEYSYESYVKIGTITSNLSSGDISITTNYISFIGADIRITIKSDIQEGNLIEGEYEGKYDYIDDSTENNINETLGDGSFSFSYTNKTYPLNNGVLCYYGLDTNTKKRDYKLFLTNEEGEYLQFHLSSENILGANLENAIYKYPDMDFFYYSSSWIVNFRKNFYSMTDGHIGIKRTINDYNIMIQCGYNIYNYFPIEGTYIGNLTYIDSSKDLIDYKGKNHQIESIELTYEGIYRNLHKYDLSIKTTLNDKINLKIYTDKSTLSENYIFDEIIRESVVYDCYESFINISNEPSIGFWHTGTLKIETPNKESSVANLDFRGKDESGNFINIIYHGLMTIK